MTSRPNSRAARKRRNRAAAAAAPRTGHAGGRAPAAGSGTARPVRPGPGAGAGHAAPATVDDGLPPWDRGPVRAHLRDLVDARRHLMGVLFVPAFGLALITTFGPASDLQRTLQVVSLIALGVVLMEAVARGLLYTRMTRAEFPDRQVNPVSSTFYVFMRAHRPRSMRRPAPRLRP